MKRLELWKWRHFDPVRKRNITTRFVLSEADAAMQYRDGATEVDGSLEARGAGDRCRVRCGLYRRF